MVRCFALGCKPYLLSESMLTTLNRDMTVHPPAAPHLREMKLVQWCTCSPCRDSASTMATTMTTTTLMSPSSRVCLRPRRVQPGSHRTMRLSRRHSGFGLPCRPYPGPWKMACYRPLLESRTLLDKLSACLALAKQAANHTVLANFHC